jgi:hypothetical protein
MDAKSEIDAQGPNAGLQGRGVESQSGRAIMAQQQAGLAEENMLFDAHNDWKLRVYRAFWARAKQFWTEPMFLRIADDQMQGGQRFTPVNQLDPEQMQMMQMMQMGAMPGMMPGMGMPQIDMNNLAQMDVDIIIEAAPDMITLQHEQFTQLTEMAAAGVPIPPDVLLEASQLRNKRELIERLQAEMSAQGQLAQAQQQLEEMGKALQAMQQQMGQGPQASPLEMARAQGEQAKVMREDALARARIEKISAETMRTMNDALRPR